jgi:hypothetical protein
LLLELFVFKKTPQAIEADPARACQSQADPA